MDVTDTVKMNESGAGNAPTKCAVPEVDTKVAEEPDAALEVPAEVPESIEQYVADDAHRAGKLPVGAPDHRVRRFAVIMHEQLDEPCGHRTSPLERIHLLNVVQLRL